VPPVPAVTIDVPRAFEANPGIVRGRVRGDVTQVLIYARRGSRVTLLGSRPVAHGRFHLGPIGLRSGDQTILAVAYEGSQRVGSARVTTVYGLPRTAFRTVPARTVSRAVEQTIAATRRPATTAVWARGMASGVAASYNAGARFTAASTLKLAILMTLLARTHSDPTALAAWPAVRKMIIDSDNDAADDVEVALGDSTLAASNLVNAFCHRMGCRDTDMYGGYLRTTGSAPRSAQGGRVVPPVTIDDPPSIATYGKHTTAHDLGVLLAGLVAAGHGQGRAAHAGISPREARVAIWLLVHARYPGLVRPSTSQPVAHKAGWGDDVQHDAALIFTRKGTVVLVIMSQGAGAGLNTTGAYARPIVKNTLRHLP
jgi:hypothetical protein